MKLLKNPKLVLTAMLFLVASAYLYMNLGGMITRTAEKIASDALGVKVDIGSIDVSLAEKKVTVNTLKIGNPPGYHNNYAITTEQVLIGLNTASKELIDFKNVQVKGSVVNLEMNKRGVNLVDLKNLANQKAQRESVGSKQIRVIVRHMVIEASTINPSIELAGKNIRPVRMPAITFSGMGTDGGMEAGDVIAQVMVKYLAAVQNTAASSGLLQGLPTSDGVKDVLGGAAEGMKSLFE